MVVELPVDLAAALVNAARHRRCVAKRHRSHDRVLVAGVADSDVPRYAARLFPVRHHVASEVDEEVLQALFEKRARELVGDPPLGNSSDVDCRLRVGKLGEIAPALFPYADAAPVDMGDSFAKCILRGNDRAAQVPQLHGCAHRDVEAPVAVGAVGKRALQKVGRVARNLDRGTFRPAHARNIGMGKRS